MASDKISCILSGATCDGNTSCYNCGSLNPRLNIILHWLGKFCSAIEK